MCEAPKRQAMSLAVRCVDRTKACDEQDGEVHIIGDVEIFDFLRSKTRKTGFMKILPSQINFRANKISKRQANYFKEQLEGSKSVDIVCHESTDRDSLNSAIAMQRYMDSLGVNSRIIVSNEHSKLGITKPTFRYVQSNEINENIDPPDTVLCLDFSAKERINKNVLDHIRKGNKLLCIDHHNGVNLFNDNYLVLKNSIDGSSKAIESAVPCYIDTTAVSATSIIYRLF